MKSGIIVANKFLPAKKLGLTENRKKALVKTLKLLESGKLHDDKNVFEPNARVENVLLHEDLDVLFSSTHLKAKGAARELRRFLTTGKVK